MANCPKCHAEKISGESECRRCGVIFGKVQVRSTVELEEGASDVWVQPKANPLTNKYLLFAFFAVALVAWKKWPLPKFPAAADGWVTINASPNAAFEAAVDPCAGRPYCLYVYVSPWCPSCHRFLPHIQEIRGAWKEPGRPGLKVIIGNDKPAAIAEMAGQIGAPTYMDEKERFRAGLRITSIPRLIVVGPSRRIVAEGDDALEWLNDEIGAHSRAQ